MLPLRFSSSECEYKSLKGTSSYFLPAKRPLTVSSFPLPLAGARRRRGPIGEHEPALGVPRIRKPNH